MKTKTIEKIIKNYREGKITKIGNYKYYVNAFPIQWNGKAEPFAMLIRKHKDADSMKPWDNLGQIKLYSVLFRGHYAECWQYSELTFLSEESANEYISERKLAGSDNVYDIFEEDVNDLMYFIEEGGSLLE
jgi:hypothetical protein